MCVPPFELTEHDSSRRRGGGFCYINDAWSSNAFKVDGNCSPDVKFLMLTYRLYYLSKDIQQFVAAVYNPLKTVLQKRYDVIMIQMKNNEFFFYCRW